MNEDKAKGTWDKLKGDAKEGLGKLTGNEELEAEGKMDQIGGKGRKALGDLKQAVDDIMPDDKDRLRDEP